MPPILHIQLLGDFHLAYGDASLTKVSTSRLKSLLAYLLLHCDAPQSRHHLAFLFWPDSTETQAHNNLRQSVHRLRQSLPGAEGFLHSDAQTIQWLPDSPFTLDIVEFEKLAENPDSIDSLQYAVSLYHGDLLPDCYDDWISIDRDRLQQKFHSILERLIHLLEIQGNFRFAIQYAERMLKSDPLREETYRQLIRLYALSGNRTGAVRVYQTCVRVLKHELGVEPGTETLAIFKELQKTQVQPASRVGFLLRTDNLPTYLTSFIGREADLERLTHILSPGVSHSSKERLFTLTGPGGCGKTRLAIQAARCLIDEFSDGVWFIDVAALTNSDLIPNAIASVLNLQQHPERDLLLSIVNQIQDKKLLLIFDNCESMVSACANIIELLLHSCSHIQILATSREKLNVLGERVWPVPPLSLPGDNDLTVSTLTRSDAVRLFIERACSILPTFVLSPDHAASIVQICQRLDGLPLAIELAAVRVAVLTPAQIAARLDNAFQLLARASPSIPRRHQTLQATMDWSYDLLSEKERLLFQRLSVFAGGFTLEAVEAVCADGQGQVEIRSLDILDLLSRLIDKSLVAVSDWAQGDRMRYRLLQPTWQYAHEKFSHSEDWEPLRLRHLDYFLNLAEEAELHFTHLEQAIWFDILLAEHDNLMAAIDWSLVKCDLTRALRLIGSLWYYWLARSYYKEGLKVLVRTLTLTKAEPPSRARAKALWSAGAMYMWSESDWSQARPLLEEALVASRALGDKQLIAGSLGTLGATAFGQGDYANAKMFLTESLAIFPEVGDKHGSGWSLAYLGDLYHLQQDLEQAQRLYENSIENFKQIGDINSLAYPIRRLGVIALERGNDLQAIALFKDSLKMNREVSYPKGIAACLGALARAALRQGKFIHAAKLTGASEKLLEAVAGNLFPTDQADFERTLAELHTHLDGAPLEAAMAEGRVMKITEAVDYALQIVES